MVTSNEQQNSKDWALPGDVLSTTEEYVPGRFTIDDQGRVISLAGGRIKRDEKNLVISVEPTKKRVMPRTGDIAYGQVIKIDGRHDTVRVGAICGKDNVLKEYIVDANLKSMGQRGRRGESGGIPQFKVGDIIRGRFSRVSPFYEVTVSGKHFGAVKSLCSRCRKPLVEKNNALYCENCERNESRKFADDYGNVQEFGDVDER
ncbi:hypothetical protein IX51_07115 [uncultured archaeon]|nr:hypothetical protein IX51_07115 [uncultured archaeon]HKJ97071.1 exosome complex RNA-binding protein Csl4 [Thermoplasmataceae archaeon]